MARLSDSLPVTDESKLIGWLCFTRHQWTNGVECILPSPITRALIKRAWLKRCDGKDGCVGFNAHLTDKGTAVSDLHAAEWGIDAIKEKE